jgi:hypothetical protein
MSSAEVSLSQDKSVGSLFLDASFGKDGKMNNKQVGFICSVLCLLVCAGVSPVMADPLQDSSNWAGSGSGGAWEGTTLPYGSGQFGADWFDTAAGNEAAYEIAQTALQPGDSSMNIKASTGALWYTKTIAANFTTGASVEWRIKSYYGTANAGQDFISIVNADRTKNVFMNFTYPDAMPSGKITFLDQTMAFNMSSGPSNTFHTFRITVLGTVAKLYIDDNATASLTATVGSGPGYGLNGLEWGDKLMATDFRYIRWTTAGAFAPVSGPLYPAEPFSSDWEGAWEGNTLPFGSGLFEEAWFAPKGAMSSADFEISKTSLDGIVSEPDNTVMNVSSPDALWYKKTIAFNFATGASVEMRFRGNYGTANAGQDFIAIGDGTKEIFMNLSYPDSMSTGKITFLNQSMAFPMQTVNGFHTFRLTVLGTVAKLYIDDSPTASLTATPQAYGGYGYRLGWGDKLMNADFDYVRWTTTGPWSPPTACDKLWHTYPGGMAEDLNHDCSVNMLDLNEFVGSWMSCNDPAGCP